MHVNTQTRWDGLSGQMLERREAIRYPVNSETTCPFVLPVLDDIGPARIKDVSLEGVGILVSQPVEPDTLIVVALRNETHQFLKMQLVQVAHCTRLMGGNYQIGGTFLTPLTYEELRTFLM